MSKKSGWGVKWEVVWPGAGLFFGAGIPAVILCYSMDVIYLWLVVISFTGLLALIWGLMGEGAKY